MEGPPIPITIDIIKKAISQIKAAKAPGPSGIVVEIRAASDMGAYVTSQLQSFAMVRYPLTGSRVPMSASTRKRGMHFKRGNYHDLKLAEQVMKVLEWIVDGLMRQLVSIDDSQFGADRSTTDAIFVDRQLQKKCLAVNRRLHMAVVDLKFRLIEYLERASGDGGGRGGGAGMGEGERSLRKLGGAVSLLVRGTMKCLM